MTAAFALKEWSAVCGALAAGRQIITLRKGGIEEEEGEFRPAHREFYLYPTVEHQKAAALRPEGHPFLQSLGPPTGTLILRHYATCVWVDRVPTAAAARRLADHTLWTGDAMEQRFHLYPDKPLWVLALRVWTLQEPLQRPEDPSYAGCRSWVPLVDVDAPTLHALAVPAVPEPDWASRLAAAQQSLIDSSSVNR